MDILADPRHTATRDWRGIIIRPAVTGDSDWLVALATAEWGGTTLISRGRVHRLADLCTFVAEENGEPVGMLALHIDGDACEVVALQSTRSGSGIGRALMAHAVAYGRQQGCRKLWLVTTNDNTRALRFYQRLGLRIVAWRLDAIARYRLLKPQIPLRGADEIPIRDEIELALDLMEEEQCATSRPRRTPTS